MRETKLPIFSRKTKRGAYWYCHVRTTDGQRPQRALHIRDDGTEASRRAAVAAYWQEQARATAGASDRVDRARKPLGEAVDALRAQQELAGVTDGCLENTVNRGKRLMQHFGVQYDLRQLNTQSMVEYATAALAARAPTTVRAELDTLCSAMRAVGVVPPRRPKVAGNAKPQQPLTRTQILEFFAALPYGQRLLGLALIMLGCRASEVAKIGDIDWERQTLWIYGTKTERSRRELPIPDDLFAHMLELRRWNQWKGFPKHTRQAIDKMVRKTCVRAGIGPRSVNDLRGTWATLAALDGVSADIRAAWQGNSAKMQERVYSQPTTQPDDLRRAIGNAGPRVRSSKALAVCTGYAPAEAPATANTTPAVTAELAESLAK